MEMAKIKYNDQKKKKKKAQTQRHREQISCCQMWRWGLSKKV